MNNISNSLKYIDKKIIFQMKDINKSFGPVKVLKNMQLSLYKGMAVGVVGENGAGKSTLMKIMAGIYSYDSGKLFYEDKLVHFKDIHDSKKKGIVIIHQEQHLASALTVAQNIFLGTEPRTKLGTINNSKMNKEAKKYLDKLNANFTSTDIVKNLTIAQKQLVEIAKALSQNPKIIIFDEPTSVLTNEETEKLYEIIEILKNETVAIAWITHRMEEIQKMCEYISIIRDGNFISELKTNETTIDNIIKQMVGRELTDRFPKKIAVIKKDPKFIVKNLKSNYLKNISFTLQPGEITFFYGLVGAKRTELGLTIAGALPYDGGEITFFGKNYKPTSTKKAIRENIYYLSENRKEIGLNVNKEINFNVSNASLHFFTHKIFKFVNDKKINKKADECITNLSVKANNHNQLVKDLSGGNQQKISFCKGLATKPKLFIVDEPTRGVDVGARKEIYDVLNDMKINTNTLIMVISSDLAEVIGLADRVICMNNGKIIASLIGDNINQETILKYALNIKGGASE